MKSNKIEGIYSDYSDKHIHYIQEKKATRRTKHIVNWPRFAWPIRLYDNLAARLYKVLSASR